MRKFVRIHKNPRRNALEAKPNDMEFQILEFSLLLVPELLQKLFDFSF